MGSDPSFTASDPGRNLPPVRPPSGRFIAQLFLVPGLIVFFVVLLVLAINYMFVGGQSANQLLIRIDSDNGDIRWRGANDLAQVLKRKDSPLRTDVGFALDLCERLDKASKALDADEKTIADANKGDKSLAAFRKLEAQRNLVNFLASSLGEFAFPAGAPVLCDIVAKDDSPDEVNGSMRRRFALLALGNAGINVKQFPKLTPVQQELILGRLGEEAKSESPVRRKAAKTALAYLGSNAAPNDPEAVAVDTVLDRASRTDDVHVREVLSHTLNFWNGPLVEETLARLSQDKGQGKRYEAPEEN